MTVRLTQEEVAHVAGLARLTVTDDEASHYAEQLTEVLALIAQMDTAEVRAHAPMAHTQATTNVLRADKPIAGLSQDSALAGAPAVEDGGFWVPRILGEEL
ncbi:MAG: Asp-tRNA(Asn)/Glu-tRNA(Gln) amidotransferase subunit GatC [Ferrimicrobium sp.]